MAQENNIEYFEKFDDYLNNQLNETEREVFEQKLKLDNSFAEAFELYKLATVATTIHEIDNLKGILDSIDYEGFELKEKRNKTIKIVAGVLLLVGLLTTVFVYNLYNNKVENKNEFIKHKQSNKVSSTEKSQFETTLPEKEEVVAKVENNSSHISIQENVSNVQSLSGNNQTIIGTKHVSIADHKQSTSNVDLSKNSSAASKTIDFQQQINITANVEHISSCKGESTGKIIIKNIKFAGNNIQVFLNQKLVYQGSNDELILTNLSEGNYYIQIVDSKNSPPFTHELQIDAINNSSCINKINGIVNINTNQWWILDVENYTRIISIYGMGGNLILKKVISANEAFEWNGTDSNGNVLPLSTYLVEITDNQEVLKAKGTVTVIGH